MHTSIINLTAETALNLLYEQKPKHYFEIGEKTLARIRQMKDGENHYFWQPSVPPRKDTFLGYSIKEVEGEAFKFITVVNDQCNVIHEVSE